MMSKTRKVSVGEKAGNGGSAGEGGRLALDRESGTARLVGHFVRRRQGVAGMVVLGAIVASCLGAPLIAPYSPVRQSLTATLQGPSASHLLGTDVVGRDVLSRLLYGGTVTFVGVGEALSVYIPFGMVLGLVSGFSSKLGARVAERFSELLLSIPALIFVLVVIGIFPGRLLPAMMVFGLLGGAGLARIIRAVTLTCRSELFVDAARVSGVAEHRILLRHILPQVIPALIAQSCLFAGVAVLVQSGLGFLGLVTPPPHPSWGGMVASGLSEVSLDPWLIVPPGLIMAVTALALAVVGESLNAAIADTVSGQTTGRLRGSGIGRLRKPGGVAQAERRGGDRKSLGPVGVPELLQKGIADGGTARSDVQGAVVVERLYVAFRSSSGPVSAVEDVSLSLRAGETVGIVGETGSGKSTMIKAILGLLGGSADVSADRVLIEGKDAQTLGRKDPFKLRGHVVGYVSQQPLRGLDPMCTVKALVVEGLRANYRLRRDEACARVPDVLSQVRLPASKALQQKRVYELSGGMAQRVSIALALLGGARVLIADEPTSALDVTVQSEILGLIRALQRERGLAVLIVSHDWRLVGDFCDRVVVLYAGQVVEEAKTMECISRPAHPYTKALLQCVPDSRHPGERVKSIPGAVPRAGEWETGCHFAPRCEDATAECRTEAIGMRTDGRRLVRCRLWTPVGVAGQSGGGGNGCTE